MRMSWEYCRCTYVSVSVFPRTSLAGLSGGPPSCPPVPWAAGHARILYPRLALSLIHISEPTRLALI
eukprot:6292443-Alexandrium_andersonii.AAC.1